MQTCYFGTLIILNKSHLQDSQSKKNTLIATPTPQPAFISRRQEINLLLCTTGKKNLSFTGNLAQEGFINKCVTFLLFYFPSQIRWKFLTICSSQSYIFLSCQFLRDLSSLRLKSCKNCLPWSFPEVSISWLCHCAYSGLVLFLSCYSVSCRFNS